MVLQRQFAINLEGFFKDLKDLLSLTLCAFQNPCKNGERGGSSIRARGRPERLAYCCESKDCLR